MQIIYILPLHHRFRFVVMEDKKFIIYCILQKLFPFQVLFLGDVENKLSKKGVLK